jgi:hypothetical protein
MLIGKEPSKGVLLALMEGKLAMVINKDGIRLNAKHICSLTKIL